jgi:hypothetical protein
VPGVLVYTVVTEAWGEPGDTTDTPTGTTTFELTEPVTAPGYVPCRPVRAPLVAGAIAQQLMATDADSLGAPLVPSTAQFRVTEQIDGAPDSNYYINVPAVPSGSRAITDGVVTTGSFVLTSLTAAFTVDDELAYVRLPQVPVGTRIAEYIDAHTVHLTAASPVTATGVDVLIGASVSLSQLRMD